MLAQSPSSLYERYEGAKVTQTNQSRDGKTSLGRGGFQKVNQTSKPSDYGLWLLSRIMLSQGYSEIEVAEIFGE